MNIQLQEMLSAYIECLLWCSTDDDDKPLDFYYDESYLDESTRATMLKDCTDFISTNAELIEKAQEIRRYTYSWAQCGHDFCLTRNGHGAGFWDRGLGEIGQKLTKAAKFYGEFNLYFGDDGKIHC